MALPWPDVHCLHCQSVWSVLMPQLLMLNVLHLGLACLKQGLPCVQMSTEFQQGGPRHCCCQKAPRHLLRHKQGFPAGSQPPASQIRIMLSTADQWSQPPASQMRNMLSTANHLTSESCCHTGRQAWPAGSMRPRLDERPLPEHTIVAHCQHYDSRVDPCSCAAGV